MKTHDQSEQTYMQRALELASYAFGNVSPNPYVGAVIVKEGIIIGEGYHHQAGTEHAEIQALKHANAQGHHVAGATIYVSLEPCNHQGRTGPCTQALIQAQIKEVVYAIQDPNPQVSGNGHRCLENAGIQVRFGLCAQEATFINRIFIHQQSSPKRPYVILKAAMSLDGKMATQTHDAKWITTEPARQKAHAFRQQCDAILIGRGTLLADNPSLTVRDLPTETQLSIKQPIRIIVLSRFDQITMDFNLFQTDIAPTWVLYPETVNIPNTLHQAFIDKNVRLIPLPKDADTDLHPLKILNVLSQNHIHSVLIEGGPQIHNAFLNADYLSSDIGGCIDEYALFYGPCLIGHIKAPSLWDHSPIHNLSQAPKIDIIGCELLGHNILIHARKQGK